MSSHVSIDHGRPPGDDRPSAAPGDPSNPPPPAQSRLRKVPWHGTPETSTGGAEFGEPDFPARLFERPNHVLVYGPSRPLVNLTVFALAVSANPEFHWVEITTPNEPRMPCDPIQLGWIPESRLWLVDVPEVLRPNESAGSSSLVGLIHPDEPADSLRQLTEFLRLPEGSQKIIASQVPNGHPGVVVVTNVHRVGSIFSAKQVPSILAVHRNAGFSVMASCGVAPGPDRDLFDFVFRLQGEDNHPQDWKKSQLVCEKGISSGPLRNLRAVPLSQIPILAEVFSRACPT